MLLKQPARSKGAYVSGFVCGIFGGYVSFWYVFGVVALSNFREMIGMMIDDIIHKMISDVYILATNVPSEFPFLISDKF